VAHRAARVWDVPFYEYRRPDGTTFEVMQKMSDDPLTHDPETGVPVERVFSPIAIHFKGKGFYNTDYGTKKRNREKASEKSSSSSNSSDSSSSSGSSDSSSSSSSSSSDGGTKAGSSSTSSSSSSSSKD
jgi:putative FmdB family regulatory protein